MFLEEKKAYQTNSRTIMAAQSYTCLKTLKVKNLPQNEYSGKTFYKKIFRNQVTIILLKLVESKERLLLIHSIGKEN